MRLPFPHWLLKRLPFSIAHYLGTHFGNGMAHNTDPETLAVFRKIHAAKGFTVTELHQALMAHKKVEQTTPDLNSLFTELDE